MKRTVRWLSVLAVAISATSCRALLDGEELFLGDGAGGAGSGGGGTSTGDAPATSTGATSADTSSASSATAGGAPTTTTTGDPTSSTTSSSETVSTSTGGAECGNGNQVDGEQCDDGNTNPNDGCSADCQYEGSSCADPIPVSIDFGETKLFQTTNADGAVLAPGCGPGGASRFFEVVPQASGYLTAWIRSDGTDYNSALIGASTCGDGERCAGLSPNGGEVISRWTTEGETYYFAATASESGEVGNFALQLTLDAGTCSDPVDLTLEEQAYIGVAVDLASTSDPHNGTCGGDGQDAVFRVTAGAGQGFATVSTLSLDVDTVLYADATCPEAGALLACSNDGGPGDSEDIDFPISTQSYLFVDCDDDGGPFSLGIF